MNFEWDEGKARSNIAKHGVSFTLAEEVWDDPFHLIFADRIVEGEQRWHATGVVGGLKLLVVVHIYVGEGEEDRVRIIGARRATKHERRHYEDDA